MRILMKHTLSALKVVKDAYIDETYSIGPYGGKGGKRCVY